MILANHLSSFSPLIGYAFITYTSIGWRACYYWCFAWEILTMILLFIFYHPPSFTTKHSEDHKTRLQLLRQLDYFGLALFTAATTLLLLGLNWGGGQYAWSSAAVIAPIVVAGVLYVALAFWEVYMPLQYPILPPKLFRRWREYVSPHFSLLPKPPKTHIKLTPLPPTVFQHS